MPINSKALKHDTDFGDFKTKLKNYKGLIDKELEKLAKEITSDTTEQFGEIPAEVVEAFCSVLLRGGKRIRGALAIETYNMYGGQDQKTIVKAAAALEFLNTYMLIVDDIQDRSDARRGGDTAHIILRKLHQNQHLKGDSSHFGEALAMNSLLIAQHYASNLMLSLDIDAVTKVAVLQNVNKCFIVTGHGQTMDIFSEANQTSSLKAVNNTLSWKTAYYTFIDPMQLGAILAGAGNDKLKILEDFGLQAGRVFQITDDIIGTFGHQDVTGKSTMDDIKEGKRTILVVKALQSSSKSDAYFLESCLGNQNITTTEFERCKKIIKESGAQQFAQQEAEIAANNATALLQNKDKWPNGDTKFLKDLVAYLLIRQS